VTESGDGRPVALVTGANRGIGLEVARQLARRGMTVVIGAREAAKGEAAAGELASEGLDVRTAVLDVSDGASVGRLAAEIGTEFGRLDVLVNNAAAYADWSETASGADLENSKTVLDISLFGAWRVTQALLPLLRRSGRGRIVNVSSGAGSHGDPQFGLASGPSAASYAVSKAALTALTSKLAVELEGSGILVNAADPGLTATAPGMEEMGARPIPQGASSVVWAAALPDDGATGGSFRDGKPLPW
jgi:NAD(P)-dependent dehydrogenase (short-subunit alcohol dehydrogenase family)